MQKITRRSLLTGLFTSAGLTCGSAWSANTAIIGTATGPVRGRLVSGVRQFLGIPYAQPPIGRLRFKAPQPVRPWHRRLDASDYCLPALQELGHGYEPAKMSEDCLRLNIWAPDSGKNHPVMVWIHGGGNIGGSANLEPMNGAGFARNGIVCVTIEYRTGALGFLELGDLLGQAYAGSGNNGLKDQAAALHWIFENISDFGGDPGRITLGGHSAGAKDAVALLSAPHTTPPLWQGLIHSGGGQTVHSLADAHDIARQFLASSRLSEPEHLLSLPPQALLWAQGQLVSAYAGNYPFRGVVDGNFLKRRPVDSLRAGVMKGRRMLIGSNLDESVPFDMAYPDKSVFVQKQLSNISLKDFNEVYTDYQRLLDGAPPLEIRQRALTAEEYWIPSVRVAEAMSETGQTFMYRFDVADTTGPFAGKAVHGSELKYIWQSAPEKAALCETLSQAWAAFIKGEAPAATGLPPWPAYRSTRRQTLIIDETPHCEDDPHGEERLAWTSRLA